MPRYPSRPACLLLVVLAAGLAGALPAGSAWADAGDATATRFDPRFREGAPSDLLVTGTPELARGHVHAFIDLFEAAFDVALPHDIERMFREAIVARFRAGDTTERQRFLDLVDNIVEIRRCARCCNDRGVRACLRAFRQRVDALLRGARDDPAWRILRYVLERRHAVVWLGVPEVKDLAARAYLETVVFVASLGRGEAIRLSPGQLSALSDYLDRDLRRLPERVRDRLARSHRAWLLVKARWDRGRDARRLAMRWEAVRVMARLVPKTGGHTVAAGPELADYDREAARVRAADRAFDAVTALARNPELLHAALDSGLELSRGVPNFTFLYR